MYSQLLFFNVADLWAGRSGGGREGASRGASVGEKQGDNQRDICSAQNHGCCKLISSDSVHDMKIEIFRRKINNILE